jgi:hypothetical protein
VASIVTFRGISIPAVDRVEVHHRDSPASAQHEISQIDVFCDASVSPVELTEWQTGELHIDAPDASGRGVNETWFALFRSRVLRGPGQRSWQYTFRSAADRRDGGN